MESRDRKGNWRAAAVIILSITCVPTAIAQTRVDEGAVRITTAVEAEIRDARVLGVPTLAPKAFAGADEAYRGLLRDVAAGLSEEKARARGEAIKGELRGAFERAEKTKAILGRSHKSREELHRVQGLKPDEAKLREAERAYGNAVQAAEAGDEASAKRAAGEAATAYRAALIEPFLRGELAELEKKIGEARAGRVAPEVIARARRDLDQIRAEVERARGEDLALGGALADWHGKLDVIIGLIYPPFFTKPPAVIRLGNWELVVERYATRSWDFVNGVIIHAYGTAWISFDCGGLPLQPILPGIAVELVPWTLRVVSAVRDPAYEIAIEEAMKIDPRAEVGRSLELNLPKERDLGQPIKAAKLAAELRIPEGLLGGILLPTTKGQVLVLFEDLTIEPTPLPKVGHATAGTASYPAIPRIPTELVFTTAGFRLHLDTLTITTTTTTASARLEMPSSIIDGGGCRVAEIPLGTITLDSSCRYHGEFLALAWGPWIIGDTGMVVQGTGLIVDLDDNWTWPGWTGPPQGNVWQGVMLPGGATIGVPSGSMTSNIAYLRAAYSFTNGMITGGGLAAFFQLTSPFRFKTLLPYGFDVALENGFLRMQNSRIQSGSFIHGGIDFPKLAVSDGAGGGVKSSYTLLSVQEDLDLFAEIDVKSDVFWGEYVNTSPPQNAYSVNDPRTAYFFTSGRYLDPKLPVGPGGFEEPGPMFPIAAGLESKQIHGAFLMAFEQLLIHSRDVPAPPNPIKLRPVGTSWVNVVGQGVHASFDLIVRDPPDASVGPQWQTTYVGKAPFHLIWEASPEKPRIVAEFRFVDSAVYRSEGRGQIDVKGPTNAMIPFNRLAATSTAHLPGASIDLTNPIVLAYWGLGVVAKPGFTSAGVMSVKTGQIVLTAAGLTEVRHFAAPFWMTWMEILANGELGRIFFDFNGSGQQFDGFPFTLKAIGLSTWDPADATGEKAFLQAGGTAHFDFFGADYLNVKDFKNPTKLLPPFDGRKIELATDTAFGTEATDFTIAGQWGNGFGHAAYTIAYDDVDQDGFLGTGTFGVDLILDGDMASTITMARDLICMRVSETTRHDFKAGPVAHFGSMSRISGCACVEDGQLKRLLISSELEATGNVNVALRSGAYGKVEYLLTPDVSELRIRGNLYLSVVIGGDVEVNGAARFVVNRAEDFVEGEVEGSFSSYRLLSGLTAEGKLNWHLGSLGPEGYEVIQGRVIVNVISPVGGSGVEGGFFIGQNAPKEKAWILKDKDGRFDLNVSALPATLTGIYGYVRWERSVNLWVVSGGVEIFAALGGFVNVGGVPQVNSGAGPGVPVALPFVVGNFGVRIWGEIAGGLLSASAWGNFQVIAPYPFQFQGTLGLEGCVVWVACASVDVTAGVNSADGFYVE